MNNATEVLFYSPAADWRSIPSRSKLRWRQARAALRNLCFSLAVELEPAGIHVATVTIAGFVKPGTPCDPDLIAHKYWELHTQPPDAWEREIIYK